MLIVLLGMVDYGEIKLKINIFLTKFNFKIMKELKNMNFYKLDKFKDNKNAAIVFIVMLGMGLCVSAINALR